MKEQKLEGNIKTLLEIARTLVEGADTKGDPRKAATLARVKMLLRKVQS